MDLIDVDEVLAAIAAEPELPGPPPPELMALFRVDPTACLRAAVRATKANIAVRIRAMTIVEKPTRKA